MPPVKRSITTLRTSAMKAAVVAVLHAILLLYASVVASATAFNCKNSLITDEWRQTVLDRHNTLRTTLAKGEQIGSAGALPKAANMNKLNWDCNMEILVDEQIAKCDLNAANPPVNTYGMAKEMVRIGSSTCNATNLARTTLSNWWKDGAAKQADAQVADENSFTQMAHATTDGFACSYRRCSGNLFLLCFYNQKAMQGQPLYTNAQGSICDDCSKYPPNSQNKVPCAAYLCQYPLTPATVDFKMCGAVACPGKDDFSDLFRLTALDMHNYYRRLTATGWAKNGDKYSPTATKMIQLQYDKDLEEKANDYAKKCLDVPESGLVGQGENFWYTGEYNTPHEDAIKKAMESWWKPFEGKGFGDQLTYTDSIRDGDLKYVANILHDGNTKMGCAVTTCNVQGRVVVDCRYENQLGQDDTIYTAGKVCSKCKDVPATPSCSKLGGLCVAQP